jgi:hypothetical protein
VQIFSHLLAGHEVLYPAPNRLALGNAYALTSPGQFRPLHFGYATPLFTAVMEAHDSTPEERNSRIMARDAMVE